MRASGNKGEMLLDPSAHLGVPNYMKMLTQLEIVQEGISRAGRLVLISWADPYQTIPFLFLGVSAFLRSRGIHLLSLDQSV